MRVAIDLLTTRLASLEETAVVCLKWLNRMAESENCFTKAEAKRFDAVMQHRAEMDRQAKAIRVVLPILEQAIRLHPDHWPIVIGRQYAKASTLERPPGSTPRVVVPAVDVAPPATRTPKKHKDAPSTKARESRARTVRWRDLPPLPLEYATVAVTEMPSNVGESHTLKAEIDHRASVLWRDAPWSVRRRQSRRYEGYP